MNWNKWVTIGLGSVFGISHIGMIGLLATKTQEQKFPVIQPPVGDYTSYVISANESGYKISYTANDPKTMHITKDIKRKAGFLGLSTNTTQIVEEYVMDGKTNQGGPVSNKRSWVDPSALAVSNGSNPNGSISASTRECIKAVGSAEGTGRLVGTSIGAAAAPTVSNIPFVGWVMAGWVAMFGGNKGAEVAGNMAQDLNEACIEEVG